MSDSTKGPSPLKGAIWGYVIGFIVLLLPAIALIGYGCALNPYGDCNAGEGVAFLAGIGALLPAGIGALIGAHRSKETRRAMAAPERAIRRRRAGALLVVIAGLLIAAWIPTTYPDCADGRTRRAFEGHMYCWTESEWEDWHQVRLDDSGGLTLLEPWSEVVVAQLPALPANHQWPWKAAAAGGALVLSAALLASARRIDRGGVADVEHRLLEKRRIGQATARTGVSD